ncbi:hypothetical protein [Streptomyces sp. NPDC091215]|uniref:hypothetical protein n=1 Tax=Streptomyces sp. NPDC091215 TaxID=3155192 RepID=UPI0034171F5E
MSFYSPPDSFAPRPAAASPGARADRRDAELPASRRTLPSGRSSPAQQINALVTLAGLGSDGARVHRAALAEQVGKSPATVADCMAFLADLGLVEGGRGQYAVTEHGQRFAWLWPRDSAQARLLLHPLLTAHWSAAAAARHLTDGPLPQEQLAGWLRSGLPGVPLRGMYLVEWLVIGLVLVRDEQLNVHLASADPATPADPRPPAPAPPEQRTKTDDITDHGRGHTQRPPAPAGGTDHARTLLLGLTRQQIQALPDARYEAFLSGVLQSLRGALAPAP